MSAETSIAIVIPQRDRHAHLRRLLPALYDMAMKARDQFDDIYIEVVEQERGKPFNRGLMSNIGYTFNAGRCGSTIHHDVDYVPVNVDYRPLARGWSSLVGPGVRAIPDPRGFWLTHDPDRFAGGVAMFSNDAFEAINGYANEYWGWGWEDTDLWMRTALKTIPFVRRPGVHEILIHENGGFVLERGRIRKSADHIRNEGRFDGIYKEALAGSPDRAMAQLERDGLRSLDFKVLSSSQAYFSKAPFVHLRHTVVAV